jgi:hypothetical protein
VEAAKHDDVELRSQCARALRNLSVNPNNQRILTECSGVETLRMLASSSVDRVRQQAVRALVNLGIREGLPITPGSATPVSPGGAGGGAGGFAPGPSADGVASPPVGR